MVDAQEGVGLFCQKADGARGIGSFIERRNESAPVNLEVKASNLEHQQAGLKREP